MSVYLEVMLTHLPMSRMISGAGFPAPWNTRAFLCVDSAPSCGHGTVDWNGLWPSNVREPESTALEKPPPGKGCLRGRVFKSGCSLSELGSAYGISFYD